MTRRQLLVPAGLALASILGGLGVAVAQTARSADEDDLGTFPLSDSTWVIEEAVTMAIIPMWQGRPPTLSFLARAVPNCTAATRCRHPSNRLPRI